MAGKIFEKLTGKKVPGTVEEVDKIVEETTGKKLEVSDKEAFPVVDCDAEKAMKKAKLSINDDEDKRLVECAKGNIDAFFGKLNELEKSGALDCIFNKDFYLKVSARLDKMKKEKTEK